MEDDRSGIQLRGGRAIDLGFQPVAQSFVFGKRRPRQVGRRHHTGTQFPDHLFPEFRLLGNLLGSADILAQMADRCYLEKCYDRLYPEFVRGGIARKRHRDGSEEIVFASAADLIFKTPRFYQGATKRLREDLGGCYTYVEQHFGGRNLYFDELEKNINHARSIAVEGDISLLRRRPPRTTEGNGERRTPQQQLI